MFLEVFRSFNATISVVFEHPQTSVTVVAEKPSHLPSRVIMIYREVLLELLAMLC